MTLCLCQNLCLCHCLSTPKQITILQYRNFKSKVSFTCVHWTIIVFLQQSTCTKMNICIHCILLLIIYALMNIKTMSVSRLCVVSVFTSGLEKHQLTLQMQIQAGCYLLVLSESQWFLLQHYSISISLHIKILKSDIF